jgi:hypothetical protein
VNPRIRTVLLHSAGSRVHSRIALSAIVEFGGGRLTLHFPNPVAMRGLSQDPRISASNPRNFDYLPDAAGVTSCFPKGIECRRFVSR